MQIKAESTIFFPICVLIMANFEAVFLLHIRDHSQLATAAK